MTIHLSHDLHRAHQRSVLPNHSSGTSIIICSKILKTGNNSKYLNCNILESFTERKQDNMFIGLKENNFKQDN